MSFSSIAELERASVGEVEGFLGDSENGWVLPSVDSLYSGRVDAQFVMPSGEMAARFSGKVSDDTFFSDTGDTREVMTDGLRRKGIFSRLYHRLSSVLSEAEVLQMSIETAKRSTALFFLNQGGVIVETEIPCSSKPTDVDQIEFLHWYGDKLRCEVEICISLK